MTSFYIKISLFAKIFNSIWSEATFWEKKKTKSIQDFSYIVFDYNKTGNIFNVDHIQKVVILTILVIIFAILYFRNKCSVMLSTQKIVFFY